MGSSLGIPRGAKKLGSLLGAKDGLDDGILEGVTNKHGGGVSVVAAKSKFRRSDGKFFSFSFSCSVDYHGLSHFFVCLLFSLSVEWYKEGTDGNTNGKDNGSTVQSAQDGSEGGL